MKADAIRVVSTLEYPVVFPYLGEVFAVDGIDYSFSEKVLMEGKIQGPLARFYRGLIDSSSEGGGQFVECPDGTWAAVGRIDEEVFLVAQIHKSIASPKTKIAARKRIVARCKESRYLRLAQDQAATRIFREVVVHGLPNVNKNIVASCDKPVGLFTEKDLATIRNSSAQIRAISNANRVLSPEWAPARPSPQNIFKQIERQRAVLSSSLAERGVEVTIQSCRDQLKMASADIQTVLFGILDNAAKYAERSSTVRVQFGKDAASLEYRIIFEMQSVVIAREETRSIFAYGVRGVHARSFTKSGSGIGLVLANRIIAAYGGRISVTAGVPKTRLSTYARNRFVISVPSSLLHKPA